MNKPRVRRAATTLAVTAALILAATPVDAGTHTSREDGAVRATGFVRAGGVFGVSPGAFTYDSAVVPVGSRAWVAAVYPRRGWTVVAVYVRGLLPHREYGAHAHARPCGGTAADAGPHYQHVVDPVQPSVDPRYANPSNEIWLDFTTDRRGSATAVAVVHWRFGDRRPHSIVIHDHHTATTAGVAGTAGPRHACVTVPF